MSLRRAHARAPVLLSCVAASALLCGQGARAQADTPAAPGRGEISLQVVVDGPAIVIRMAAPLITLLGRDQAPRSRMEQGAMSELAARLRAADALFSIDPVGQCKLGPVRLDLPHSPPARAEADGAGATSVVQASFAFNCVNALATKFIDTSLFTEFKAAREVNARISAPQGDFRRTLKRPHPRLAWGR